MKNDRLKIFNFVIFAILFFFTRTAYAQVVINEIAWMGTVDSATNEWIELWNNGSSSLDVSGWILRIEGKKDITLAGAIAGNGYYLLERTDDTTVPTIAADLISPFGTGLANTGAILLLLDTQGSEQDRVNGSDNWKIGGVDITGNNTTKETAQRVGLVWRTGVGTPRAINQGVTPPALVPVVDSQTSSLPQNSQTPTSTNLSNFPVEPQIIAEAGTRTRTAPAGAPLIFVGKVFGLKKESIENARMIWSFGDGARAEGTSVNHAYYYPGEYIVVLDASSGLFAASDRVKVLITTPNFVLRTGGNSEHSFVVIENHTDSELDLSGWHVSADGKNFVLPQSTLLSARKTVTLASEITGLMTPVGSIAFLHFPNGSLVKTQNEVATILSPTPVASKKIISKSEEVKLVRALEESSQKSSEEVKFVRALEESSQKSSVLDAFSDTESPLSPTKKERSMWPWYTGVLSLGAGGLLGLRFARSKGTIADEFKIIEDKN